MAYSFGQDMQLLGLNLAARHVGEWGDFVDRNLGPYNRYNRNGYGTFIDWAGGPLQIISQATNFAPGAAYNRDWELRNALSNDLAKSGASENALAWWNSLSDAEKDAKLANYWVTSDGGIGNLWGLTGDLQTFDFASLLRDLNEYDDIQAKPLLSDYADLDKIESEAKSAIEDENEMLLASLNQELQNTNDAYNQSRNALLSQQYMRNQQAVDAIASDMSRARRNAIEAGASAGVRIAENVNAVLSAQNKMSQQSLETSNQLAQMLINQRNAESGLRNQWRDAQMSTYDRTAARADSEYNRANARYTQDLDRWQNYQNDNTSDDNLLAGSIQTYKNKNKKPTYSSNTGSGY